MEQIMEPIGQAPDNAINRGDAAAQGPVLPSRAKAAIAPQSADCKCGCGSPGSPESESEAMADFSFVYALGRVEPRFPSPGVEKEFAQATGRSETAGLSDRQALHSVLSRRENRYLARQLCWVFSIGTVETYI